MHSVTLGIVAALTMFATTAIAQTRLVTEEMNLARHRVPSHSARALAASERLSASVRFRAVTGRPSRQLPRLGLP
jgi:hypothetical protein